MRVAVATQDLTRIDAHFGWAKHMMFFDISAEGYHLVRTHRFRGPLQADGDPTKLAAKIRTLRGCSLVFVQDIGLEASARLNSLHIQAVRSYANRPISEALEDLVSRLRQRPPRWLRREEQRSRQSQARLSLRAFSVLSRSLQML